MDKTEILTLFAKYKRGECTAEEKLLLHQWLEKGKFVAEDISEEEIAADLALLEKSLPLKKPSTRRIPIRSIGYAASLLLALFALGYYYYPRPSSPTASTNTDLANLDPGSNRAILLSSDGSSFILDSLTQNQITQIDGSPIKVNEKGQLVYFNGETQKPSRQHKIIIPKGGQYEVILPDSTHIWLNSESTLSFANNFNNHAQRAVELTGEAYFEVASNKNKPFVVSVQGQQIKVLGTAFNVNAYSGNNYIKTSLVEGSVLFNKSRLKPGQTALFENNSVRINEDNMDDVLAWKNGYFAFFEESLEEAMKQIARWYDLEVSFADEETKRIVFGGSISKYENASQIFRMIEKAGNVRITVESKKITINKAQTIKTQTIMK